MDTLVCFLLDTGADVSTTSQCRIVSKGEGGGGGGGGGGAAQVRV